METQMVHDENDCPRLKQKDGQLPVSQLETEMASNRSDCLTAEQKDGFWCLAKRELKLCAMEATGHVQESNKKTDDYQ